MSAFLNINALSQSPLRNDLIEADEEYRYAYAEDFLNTYIATQIRVLRDQREMTQGQLAEAIGTKQSGISRLENVNYSNWKTETLKKIARAFGVRLRISFESFGSLLGEDATFSRDALKRAKFEDDPAFLDQSPKMKVVTATTAAGFTQKTLPFDRPTAIGETSSNAAFASVRQPPHRTTKRVRRYHVREEAA